ncbi:MAG: DUF883 domain-containing protein [Rhizomicrobium sp.]|jgi:ElaB/YqjD/DUF883 family membrane-anchored ribosome-binding protein
MTTETSRDTDALIAELKQLRADFAKLGELLQATARHASEDAVQRAKAQGEKAWAEAKTGAEDVIQKIEQNPLSAAGIAFGVGMLLGLLFARRS